MGYASAGYAATFRQFGQPVPLTQADGWLLKRPIPHSSWFDAMGCYPLFDCQDWSQLSTDLDGLAENLVAVSLVSPPLPLLPKQTYLGEIFPDLCRPFKPHFVVDLAASPSPSRHHRYYAKRALGELEVEVCADPTRYTEEWSALYDVLIHKHLLQGMRAFSRQTFAAQLALPDLVLLRAHRQGVTVGAHLWMMAPPIVYSHLAACTAEGYRLGAAYALHQTALDYFQGRARWLDLGGAPGSKTDEKSGLGWFKQGWSTATMMTYLCGRIFDRSVYHHLKMGAAVTDYFPPYRAGEFHGL